MLRHAGRYGREAIQGGMTMSMPPYGPYGPQDSYGTQDHRPEGPNPPPPGYHPPYGYGYGYGATEHPQGTMILVLGILGVTACQLIAPVAWIMGNNALREIDLNPMAYSNRGMVQAGRICGIVGSVLMILTVAWLVIALGIVGLTTA
jgi:hypothetical protein